MPAHLRWGCHRTGVRWQLPGSWDLSWISSASSQVHQVGGDPADGVNHVEDVRGISGLGTVGGRGVGRPRLRRHADRPRPGLPERPGRSPPGDNPLAPDVPRVPLRRLAAMACALRPASPSRRSHSQRGRPRLARSGARQERALSAAGRGDCKPRRSLRRRCPRPGPPQPADRERRQGRPRRPRPWCRRRSGRVRVRTGCGAAWLARLTGGQEVESSNLSSPTSLTKHFHRRSKARAAPVLTRCSQAGAPRPR